MNKKRHSFWQCLVVGAVALLVTTGYAPGQETVDLIIRNGRIVDGSGKGGDMVIFDPEKVQDKATFADPLQFSEGMDSLLRRILRAMQAACRGLLDENQSPIAG